MKPFLKRVLFVGLFVLVLTALVNVSYDEVVHDERNSFITACMHEEPFYVNSWIVVCKIEPRNNKEEPKLEMKDDEKIVPSITKVKLIRA